MGSNKKSSSHDVEEMYDALVDDEEKQRISKAIEETQRAKGNSQKSSLGKKITSLIILIILLIAAIGLSIEYYSTLKARLTQTYQRTITSCILKVDLNCLNHSIEQNEVTILLGNRMPKTIYLEEAFIGNCTIRIGESIAPTGSKEIRAPDCQLDDSKKYNLSLSYRYTRTGIIHTTKGNIGFLLGKSE
ncbi:hypothetical protein HYW21_04265 [Candidatus Woesearchaeota archaeon]|nr:hypothetical protein [Candidatus Woesearchaeota archaeon]